MIRYLTVEQVLRANERHGGDSGIRDRALIEAAVARPQAGFGGVEVYPTLWDKAAALLHGIVSTQGFHDGNKRTGWAVTAAFLRANGRPLHLVPSIDAEAFVMSVAVTAWTDQTVARASEWLKQHTESMVALPQNELELVLEYRGQVYMILGASPFIVLKATTTTFDQLGQHNPPFRQVNLAIAPDEVLAIADLLRELHQQMPKPGVRPPGGSSQP